MKKWIVCLIISLVISFLGLAYFVNFVIQDGNSNYSLQSLMSPLPIVIFFAIVLGISSALVQLHSILLGVRNKNI